MPYLIFINILWSSLELRRVAGTSYCAQIAEITSGESQSLSGQRGLITNLRSFILAEYPRNFEQICWSNFCQHGTMPPQDTLTQIPGMKFSFKTPSSSSSSSSSSPRGLLVVGSNVSSYDIWLWDFLFDGKKHVVARCAGLCSHQL